MKTVASYAKRVLQSLLLLILIYVVFRVGSKGLFGSWDGIKAILRQSVIPCIIAWGISANMSLGIWDFSPGVIIVLGGILGGRLALATQTGIIGFVAFCMLIALALNMIICLLQYWLAVPTMVLSLGAVLVMESVNVLIFDGSGVKMAAMRQVSNLAKSPWCFLILIAAFLYTYFGLNYTKFGYQIRALGNNFEVAKNIGINPLGIKLKSYLFGGVLIGLATAMNLASEMQIRPDINLSSVGTIFSAMMGVIIGGYLSKYCNITIGIVIGTVAMKMLSSGLLSVGLGSSFQRLSTGAMLIVFAAISSNQGRMAERKALDLRAKAAIARRNTPQ